jgi:BetI-type transcriptional repressor, C-terminal
LFGLYARESGTAYGWLLAVLSGVLRRATAHGELSEGRNPDLEAVRLLAVIDGMTLARVLSPDRIGVDDALAVIDRHLVDLPGEPSTLPA